MKLLLSNGPYFWKLLNFMDISIFVCGLDFHLIWLSSLARKSYYFSDDSYGVFINILC